MHLFLASEYTSFPKITGLIGDRFAGRKALFITTAAIGEGYVPDPETNIKPMQDIGLQVLKYDLQGKTQQQLHADMSDVYLVCVCGGNTYFLMDHMQRSGFAHVMRERFAVGAVYMGNSAGVIVCAPDIAYIGNMDDPHRANLTTTTGLGFVDFAIVPHLDSATARERCESYAGDVPLVALRDSQFLEVRDKIVKVYELENE